MVKYRVDCSTDRDRVPCGMNSILYCGDSWRSALQVYNLVSTGLDSWGRKNPNYGVVLSQWDNRENDYIVLRNRGFNDETVNP